MREATRRPFHSFKVNSGPPDSAGTPRVLTCPPPNFTSHQAVRIASRFYGFEATAHLLVAERDQNFLLTAQRGDQYLLKIANSAEDPAVCHHQSQVLTHLAAADQDLPVPNMVPALSGQLECRVISGAGEEHQVRLLTWLNGKPLADQRPGPRLPGQMGATLARLDLALARFDAPVPTQELLWDLQHADKLLELVHHVQSPDLQAIARRRLERYREHTRHRLNGFRRQLIYNDLNPHNVLTDPHDADRLAGIIDFGDMVEAPLIFDLAVACAYLVEPKRPAPFTALQRLLAAYHAVCPLMAAEQTMLAELVALRHVLTVVITHWRASQHPDNSAYILRNEPVAAGTLRLLEKASTASLDELIMASCETRAGMET